MRPAQPMVPYVCSAQMPALIRNPIDQTGLISCINASVNSSQEREVARCTTAMRDELKKALATSETKVECIRIHA